MIKDNLIKYKLIYISIIVSIILFFLTNLYLIKSNPLLGQWQEIDTIITGLDGNYEKLSIDFRADRLISPHKTINVEYKYKPNTSKVLIASNGWIIVAKFFENGEMMLVFPGDRPRRYRKN